MSSEDEAKQALDAIDAAITADDGTGAERLDDLCPTYQGIKPQLQQFIAFLQALPIGQAKQVAKAMQFLMVLADMACPVDGKGG